jgi:hypothetical protein
LRRCVDLLAMARALIAHASLAGGRGGSEGILTHMRRVWCRRAQCALAHAHIYLETNAPMYVRIHLRRGPSVGIPRYPPPSMGTPQLQGWWGPPPPPAGLPPSAIGEGTSAIPAAAPPPGPGPQSLAPPPPHPPSSPATPRGVTQRPGAPQRYPQERGTGDRGRARCGRASSPACVALQIFRSTGHRGPSPPRPHASKSPSNLPPRG